MNYQNYQTRSNGYAGDRDAFRAGWAALGLPSLDRMGQAGISVPDLYHVVSTATRNFVVMAGLREAGDPLAELYEATVLPDLGSG